MKKRLATEIWFHRRLLIITSAEYVIKEEVLVMTDTKATPIFRSGNKQLEILGCMMWNEGFGIRLSENILKSGRTDGISEKHS